jgi:hypothetical protein
MKMLKVKCKVCEKIDSGTQDELMARGWSGYAGEINKVHYKFQLCKKDTKKISFVISGLFGNGMKRMD